MGYMNQQMAMDRMQMTTESIKNQQEMVSVQLLRWEPWNKHLNSRRKFSIRWMSTKWQTYKTKCSI